MGGEAFRQAQPGGKRIVFQYERGAEFGFGFRGMAGIQQRASQREVSFEIFVVEFFGGAILLDRLGGLVAALVGHAQGESGALLIGQKLGGFLQRCNGRAGIRIHQGQTQVQISLGHLGIELDGLLILKFGVVEFLHRGVGVAQLKMNRGILWLFFQVGLVILRGGGVILGVQRGLGFRQEIIQGDRFGILRNSRVRRADHLRARGVRRSHSSDQQRGRSEGFRAGVHSTVEVSGFGTEFVFSGTDETP